MASLFKRISDVFGKKKEKSQRPGGASAFMGNIEVVPIEERKKFCLLFARALMTTGCPGHRIETQLAVIAKKLELKAKFDYHPELVLVSFESHTKYMSSVDIVRAPTKLALGKVHTLLKVFRRIRGNKMRFEDANKAVSDILNAPPEYGPKFRLVIAFLCSALICPMSFGGSFLDMLISGLFGAFLCFMQLFIAQHPIYASIFELTITAIVSFVARALSVIPGQYFCYSAISTSSIVLILPAYIILSSVLELAAKKMVAGSTRLVYGIIYSLLLGVGLTLGSDFYFLVHPSARFHQKELMGFHEMVQISGAFRPDNAAGYSLRGTFSFTQAAKHLLPPMNGCAREPDWPWYQSAFPLWTLFLLVPLYCFFSSLWKGQPFNRHLPVMILFACCSYATNRAAKQFIADRSDVTSAFGALVLGLMGNIYSRVFRGTPFTAMLTGVTFLVPSSLGYGGGLSFSGDLYAESIKLGFRMIQIAIGVAVGLYTSEFITYLFSRKKIAGLNGF